MNPVGTSFRRRAAPRIVADAMLAKLARWMRLLGVDVEPLPYVEDDRLLKYVKRTGAVLLTSDRELYRKSLKRGAAALLVESHGLISQLKYVFSALSLAPDVSREICPICGSALLKISSDTAVRRGVPKKIALRYHEFFLCRKCGKVYWQGTHRRRVLQMAELVRASLEGANS
ncbi:MAG: Mut7-C RNAse domain-containing protein [Candidatus Micrarchaeaceae archaeon]